MDEESRDPLPWEIKVAVGCLLLLALQMVHEGILYCMGEKSLGLGRNHSAWVILLGIYGALGLGLLFRGRSAWWLALIIVGGIAGLHVVDSWDPLQRTLRGGTAESVEVRILWRLRGVRMLEPFEWCWLLARNALLVAVPVLLILGIVRQQFRFR